MNNFRKLAETISFALLCKTLNCLCVTYQGKADVKSRSASESADSP